MTRLAIFDCDGTLVDGQADVCEAMAEAFARFDAPTPDLALVRRAVGLSLPQAMAMVLPTGSANDHARLAELYRAAFRARREAGIVNEPLYPGIEAVVRRLAGAGCTLAIATGKSDRGLAHCLATHALDGMFASLQTADRHPSKPHPAMIERILDETGIEPADAVMIGDTSYDMIMAEAAGVRAIGVAWGYHPAEELRAAGAAMVAEDMAALETMLGLGG